MMGCENESLTNISIFFFFSEIVVPEHAICEHDLRKEIKLVKTFLFSIIVFNMMKLAATLQFKAGKTMIKESHRGLT